MARNGTAEQPKAAGQDGYFVAFERRKVVL
jgi:hypothetical protein